MRLRTLKFFVVALCLLSLMASNALAQMSTLDKVLKAGEVRVGIDLFVHPFGMYDEQNQPIGYDVDIANELAKALDVKLKIVRLSSPGRITFLMAGKVDVVISSFTRNPERAKSIAFSIPYAAEKASLLTKKGSGIKSLEDIKGQRVASVKGITPAIALEKLVPEANLVLYDRHPDMVLALLQDKVVALADGDTACSAYIEAHPEAKLVKAFTFSEEYLSFGLKHGDEVWRNWLNTFIFQSWTEKKLHKYWEKWFPYPLPDLNLSPSF
ncbi:transporter substrate-binding domain-containing protein [Candidatus Aerophobetes bacterium]|uniref:Transporter substrate-binding domain-containing protein n=1 Tax=Aerophobetes bacterium TaxID=2030807 RepID=A0A523S430_UNCAE|nr:MAG: transporter substrate-binding domain-containing protein [Candidatus Aerophobetes bacterium]